MIRTRIRTSRRTSVSTGGCGTVIIALAVLAAFALAAEAVIGVTGIIIAAALIILAARGVTALVKRARRLAKPRPSSTPL